MIDPSLIKAYIGGCMMGTLALIDIVYSGGHSLAMVFAVSILIHFIFHPVERLYNIINNKEQITASMKQTRPSLIEIS